MKRSDSLLRISLRIKDDIGSRREIPGPTRPGTSGEQSQCSDPGAKKKKKQKVCPDSEYNVGRDDFQESFNNSLSSEQYPPRVMRDGRIV